MALNGAPLSTVSRQRCLVAEDCTRVGLDGRQGIGPTIANVKSPNGSGGRRGPARCAATLPAAGWPVKHSPSRQRGGECGAVRAMGSAGGDGWSVPREQATWISLDSARYPLRATEIRDRKIKRKTARSRAHQTALMPLPAGGRKPVRPGSVTGFAPGMASCGGYGGVSQGGFGSWDGGASPGRALKALRIGKSSSHDEAVENCLSNRKKPRSINDLRAYTVHLFHSRRRDFVVGLSFFLKSVLTVRKGLAYNPPIDAAPRFTGPARRHLKLLSHLLVHDASDPGQKTELQSPFAKGGSLTVPVL